MKNKDKTKEQLVDGLAFLRRRIAELELYEKQHRVTDLEVRSLLDQIERAKQEWESAADSLSQIICLLDQRGNILRVNLTVERWGLGKVTEVKGIGMHKLFHPDCNDPACYLQTFWTRTSEGLNIGQSAELEAEDRVLNRHLRVQAFPMAYKRRKTKAAAAFRVIIVHDITERKLAEEKLKKAYQEVELLANLVENAHEMIFVIQPEGWIIKSNSLARNTFGYSLRDMNTQKIKTLLRSETEDVWKTVTDSVKRGSHWRGNLTAVCKDGREFPVGITVSRPVNSSVLDKNENMICFVRDMTEEKEIDRMKSGFISTVSHELRTPLAIIREGISLILDKIPGEINRKQEGLLATALSNIDRLTRIINDLLDISKIDEGKVELERRQIKIAGLIRKVASSFESKAKNKGLDLRVPLSEEEISVYADEDKIIQVFTNFIGNSLKFTEKGHIEVSITDKENEVECIVSDTGMGISEENLPKLFDRFQQFGRTAGPGEKGTGLGLSIVKALIEMHGGRIWVESDLQRGTVFTFTLPKYTIGNILKEQVQSGIKEAAEKKISFSFLTVNVVNFKELTKDSDKDRKDKLFKALVEEVQKLLRRTSDVLVEEHSNIFVLLSGTGREGILIVRDRIEKALRDHINAESAKELRELKINLCNATYPDEAKTYKELIEKAQRGKNMGKISGEGD